MRSYVRVYQKKLQEPKKLEKKKENKISNFPKKGYHKYDRVFVFDTETTADTYLNLKVGYFEVHYGRNKMYNGFIVDRINNTKNENKILDDYGKEKNIKVYDLKEFVNKVFYPEVYFREALCLGFNLPFDITRITKSFGSGNHTANRKDRNGNVLPETNNSDWFICHISDLNCRPPIKIKHIDNTKSFIKFTPNKIKPWHYSGNFFDVRILAILISQDKGITLDKASEKYNTIYKKLKNAKHGKITREYLEYNIRDVKATYELFFNLLKKYEKFQLDLDITDLYSEASLGKQVYRDLGIQSFFTQNPNFDNEVIGNLMSAYYGGWVECPYRRTPVEVATTDFLSMYPSTFTLMGLWDYVVADKIEMEHCVKEIQDILDNATVDDILKPEFWKNKCVLVSIYPNNDLIPIRTQFPYETPKGEKEESLPQVGLNYINSDKLHWVTLLDLINAKVLTGKVPKIKDAIKFIPKGKQKTLKPTKLLGKTIDPRNTNVIKFL